MHAKHTARARRGIAALIALLVGPLLASALTVAPVQAGASAEPSEEIVYIDDDNGFIRVLDIDGAPCPVG